MFVVSLSYLVTDFDGTLTLLAHLLCAF